MAFQPFGYRFEVRSPSLPSDAKAAIRSRKKAWFDPKSGARGWVAGPFICLWFSAFDKHGPMLFGMITQDNMGTRVRGRAGSDLNGVLMFSLLIPLMAFLTVKLAEDGATSIGQWLVFAVVFLVGGPLLYWVAHKDRREAEPLIRFIRDTILPSGRTIRTKSADVPVSAAFNLNVNGAAQAGPVTSAAIHDALLDVGANGFVVLEAGVEAYIQTAFQEGGYVLEKREGNNQYHFRAIRQHTAPVASGDLSTIFAFEEVCTAFMAYASKTPMPPFLKWERMILTG